MALKRFLIIRVAAAALTLGLSAPAVAEVEISFYSRELGGSNFPHAFVTVKGQVDATGEIVDESYGFTAKTVSPAILFGSVGGKLVSESASYLANSDKQFSLLLSDELYARTMAVVERWRSKKQPSYNLNRANCVHFVAEMARASGLTVAPHRKLMKKPRSFLLAVKADNPELMQCEGGPPCRPSAPAAAQAGSGAGLR